MFVKFLTTCRFGNAVATQKDYYRISHGCSFKQDFKDLTAKTFQETATVLSKYQDLRKGRF